LNESKSRVKLGPVLEDKAIYKHGGSDMGDKGSKDKGKKEQKKAALLTPKEKKQLKREKKAK
jgi:hypothetical protein